GVASLGRRSVALNQSTTLCDFEVEPLDFCRKRVVLRDLSPEKANRHLHLLFETLRREDVHIRHLPLTAPKVPHLDPAFFDQSANAVVDFSDAHAKVRSEFALRGNGMLFEIAEDSISDLVRDWVLHVAFNS